ncbi:MAG: DMT family transporter [Halanaerobium sp.]|nr:DMT family transporter [Halanaerobium sp.]
MPTKSHLTSVLLALLVTFLWSTSWVLIKIGLREIPAITFAGIRYFLAFLLLLLFLGVRGQLKTLLQIDRRELGWLLLLGIFLYAITQGAQFLGLFYLPTVYVSLFLNLTPLLVLILGATFLKERPGRMQLLGVLVFLAGIILYFFPLEKEKIQLLGILIMALGVSANAIAAILGRLINREKAIAPVVVTTISMGIGSSLLLFSGLVFQGLPPLSLTNWAIIFWLALVNTAFAFTLWNKTLQHLQAAESSIINGTMLIQIALLAWVFLGEALSWKQITAILIVSIGTTLVQLKPGRRGMRKVRKEKALPPA